MIVSDTSIRRPVAVILLTVALMVFGVVSLNNMGVDLYPEIDFPIVAVMATLQGADAELMDSDVADVLEEYINTIEGLKTLSSTSSEGFTQVVAEFDLEKDVDIAAQEVRDKINQAQRDLPLDLDPPIVQKFDTSSSPFMWIAVTTTGDYRFMADYVDRTLKERLQTVSGVGSIMLGGFREREVRVWLKPNALEASGLTPLDVAQAIRTKHVELPGGRIEQPETEFTVKVMGEYDSVEALQELVVKEHADGVVRLRDVADVVEDTEDLRSIARYSRLPTVGMGIQKQSGANTVAVAKQVKAVIEGYLDNLPDGIEIFIAFDSSRFIENSMRDVLRDLMFGAILTAFAMLVFLRNVRMTIISIMAVPVSIITAFIAMYMFGFTINTMTMLAMSLAIGLVIDDTIVVLENIFRHVEEDQGKTAIQAASASVNEVAFAVIATTMTVVAVFLPVAFMRGIIGRFFFQFGMSVALAVIISTTVAFTLIPMLCSRLLKHNPNHGPIFRAFEAAFEWIERVYAASLYIALKLRWLTVSIAIIIAAIGICLAIFVVPMQFSTEPDQSQIQVRFEFPTGTSIYKSEEGMRELEDVLFAQPEVRGAFALVGTGGFGGSVNNGLMFVNLTYPHEREASQEEVMVRLRRLFADAVPDAFVSVENVDLLGGGQRSAQLEYIVQGPDLEAMANVVNSITADMREVAGIVDVDTDLRLNKPEVQVNINRNLADNLGVDVQTIAENLNILFGGLDVAKFKSEGRRYEIRMRATPDARLEPEDLTRLSVRSNNGSLIRMSNLIDITEGFGPNIVSRHNRARSATIYANLEGLPLGDAMDIMDDIVALHLPDETGWMISLGGEADVFAESMFYLLVALLIAIFCVYIILGCQFESFMHPFTIIMSVPLAIIGGIGLILVAGLSLDIFAFIGFVMLVGIVTKNGVLLVDFINQLRERGMERHEAIMRAGPLRLRPILMTATTTIAAVLPVALAFSEGGEQRAPMGMAVIGGLVTSTLLTLLVIPCVYTILDDMSHLFRHLTRGLFSWSDDVQAEASKTETKS